MDTAAENAARSRGLTVEVYMADWVAEPRRGGVIRNGVVVRNSEHLVAFWDGSSPGTLDAVRQARIEGVGVTVFRADSVLPDIEAMR